VRANEIERTNYAIRYLANPFATYAAGFLLALSVYALGYSDLYPELEEPLIWSLLATCAISAVLACAVGADRNTFEYGHEPLRTNVFIFLAIMTVFAAEVIANGGIPILLLVSSADFSYLDFGIPTVHVAFVGFCDFYAVYWFDLYLSGRGRTFLAFSLIASSTSLLIVSRGAFIITLIALVIVYVQRRGFNRKLFISFAACAGAVLWGFAFVGDLRTHGATGESIILTIGEASDRFLESNVPTTLFWPYLYISAPLANLQLNVSSRVANDAPSLYFSMEWLPDFVSKRLVTEQTISDSTPLRVKNELTVSTMYGRGFVLFGWIGLLLSYVYFAIVSFAVLRILRRSKYFVAACSILSSLALLSIFDNMYIFAGGITQILVALLMFLFERPQAALSNKIGALSN
jgi:oligosaccharide repeat unit polymerase